MKRAHKKEHIALDFDGTLSHYEGWKGPCIYGPPIPFMLAKVKKYLKEGHSFSIFTARADRENEVEGIKKWLKDNDLPDLEVTNIKSPKFTQFWDDRAIHIKKNTGMTEDEEEYYYTYHVSLQDYINVNSQRIS